MGWNCEFHFLTVRWLKLAFESREIKSLTVSCQRACSLRVWGRVAAGNSESTETRFYISVRAVAARRDEAGHRKRAFSRRFGP